MLVLMVVLSSVSSKLLLWLGLGKWSSRSVRLLALNKDKQIKITSHLMVM